MPRAITTTMPELTLKQRKFIDYYLGEANGNATKAARLAGYAGDNNALGVAGHECLSNPKIQERLREIYAASLMPAEEVLSRLAEQARGAGAYLETLTGNDVIVDVESLLADGKAHLIKSAKYTDKGQPIVEFYDAQTALVHVGRHHKLFTDKLEHDLTSISDDELDRRIAEAEARTAQKAGSESG